MKHMYVFHTQNTLLKSYWNCPASFLKAPILTVCTKQKDNCCIQCRVWINSVFIQTLHWTMSCQSTPLPVSSVLLLCVSTFIQLPIKLYNLLTLETLLQSVTLFIPTKLHQVPSPCLETYFLVLCKVFVGSIILDVYELINKSVKAQYSLLFLGTLFPFNFAVLTYKITLAN